MGLFGGGDTTLEIVIKAKDEASAVFKKMEGNVKKTSEGMKNAGKSLTKGLTLPLVALGTGAVVAAGKFEKSLGDLSTLVGAGTEDMKTFEEGIKDVLDRVPKSADDLGAAAYQIVSAGISDASLALEVLETSGKLAVAGLSTTEEATNLLTTAINAFGLDANDSGKIANVLFETVKSGKTTIAELSGAFGKMAGNAAAAGISFEEVQAATAALTLVTGKTSESQNALAQVFLELTVAGGKLDKSLEENGGSLDALNAAIGEAGLVGGFEKVRNELGLTDTQFKNLFSSAEGGTAVFQLLTSANDAYTETLKAINDENEELIAAFAAQKETFQAQFQLLKNKLNKALIELGTEIMPTLKKIMEKVSVELSKVTKWFSKLSPEMKKMVVIGLAVLAALGPIIFVLGQLIAIAPAVAFAWTIMTGPIGLLIGALTALGFFVKMIIDGFKQLSGETAQTTNALGQLEGPMSRLEGPMSRLPEEADNATEAFNNFGLGASESVGGVSKEVDELEKKMISLNKELEVLNERLINAEATRNRKSVGLKSELATAFVRQEQKIADLTEQIRNETDREQRQKLEAELLREQEALNSRRHIEDVFTQEVAEARRVADLTDFERQAELIGKRMNLNEIEFTRVKGQINAEIKENERKRDELLTLEEATTASVTEEVNKRENIVTQSVDNMINKYNQLRQAVVGAFTPMPLQSIPPVQSIPPFQHGGIVPGPSSRAVPILAHGQETILTSKKSKGGGNISITINNPVVRNDADLIRIREEIDRYFRPLMINHKITA